MTLSDFDSRVSAGMEVVVLGTWQVTHLQAPAIMRYAM